MSSRGDRLVALSDWWHRHSLNIRCAVAPAAVMLLCCWVLWDGQFALVVSLSTASLGWLNGQVLSSLGFLRSEASKNRDAVSKYLDELFDELEEMVSLRATQEDKLETVLASRVSLLELRMKHMKKRTGLELLTPENLQKLRSDPLDLLSARDYAQRLTELKFSYLEILEDNYSRWAESQR